MARRCGADAGRELRPRGRRVSTWSAAARRCRQRRLDDGSACQSARAHRRRPLRVRARPVAAEDFPDVLGKRIFADAAGGLLFRAAGRRPPLPARTHARLGRLQRRRHVLRLSRPREPRRQIRARRAWRRGRSGHAGPPTDRRRRSTRSSPSATGAFPLLRGRAAHRVREVCQYENSSNGDFLIDLHPRCRTCCWSAAVGPWLQAWPGSRPLRRRAAVRTRSRPSRASASPPKARPSTAKCISPACAPPRPGPAEAADP